MQAICIKARNLEPLCSAIPFTVLISPLNVKILPSGLYSLVTFALSFLIVISS